jgi:hypothetical protein
MNTNKSEEILNKFDDEIFGNIITELDKLSKYDKITKSYNPINFFYNPNTDNYSSQTLKEILSNYSHIKIINHTGSLNKAKIMAIMQQIL